MKRFIIFFLVIAVTSALFGILVNQESFNALFIARIFFTACLTTLLYFFLVRRSQRKR